MKSFKRLFSATVINSLVTYRKNREQEVDHLNFRKDVVKGFLVNYAVQHVLSGYHDSGQAETWLKKRPFLKKNNPPHKSKVNQYAGISSAASIIQVEFLYQCWNSDIALRVNGHFKAYHTRKYY